MSKYPDIVLCGSIAIDRIMNFQGSYKDLIQPDKIHVLSLSVLIDQLTNSDGGTAANIAYSLSLLGEKPTLLSSIGPDGAPYLAKLSKLGIDTSHVHTSKLPTATFTVLTDRDDNQVGGFYPGAMSDSETATLASWQGKGAIVVISAHDPKAMKKQIEECQKYKLTLVYDIGQQVSNVPSEDLLEGIKTATILIVNDYELSLLAKRTNQTEADILKQVPVVITTLGSQGSRVEGRSVPTPISIGIIPHVTPLDPTGAGDSYRAGFLYGYRRNWDLKTSCQLGATVAAYAVETQGTQEHSFTKDSLAKRYQQAFNEALPQT
jgi:adenosine kinase